MRIRHQIVLACFIILAVMVSTGCSHTAGTSAQKTASKFSDPALQRVIISVGNDKVSADYIVRRCCLNTSNPDDILGTMQNIIWERVIEQVASQPPYNINVTEADIDQQIKDEANSSLSVGSTTVSATVSVLADTINVNGYNLKLSQSLLTETELREMVKAGIMTQRLSVYLMENTAAALNQVHLFDIVLPDQTTANDVYNRLNSGEDFKILAMEMSLDIETKTQGGDKGWVPINALDSYLEQAATGLDIGRYSYPVQTSVTKEKSGPYYILMVTERTSDRKIDDQYIILVKSHLLENWVGTQLQAATPDVKLFGDGDNGDYDSRTDAWLKSYLQKLRNKLLSSGTTLP